MNAAALKKAEVVMLSERLKHGIIILVSTVWTISLLLAWAFPERYKPSPEINGLFSLVVAAVLVTKKKEDDPDA